jgi:cytochrome P450
MLVDKKTLTMADTENHARLRKAMNPAFSSRALASQEPILQQNVELFLEKLHDHATRGLQLDLRLWYNYITFDMIGDLAFGESFGCLDSSKFHAWVQFVVDYFYVATLLQQASCGFDTFFADGAERAARWADRRKGQATYEAEDRSIRFCPSID